MGAAVPELTSRRTPPKLHPGSLNQRPVVFGSHLVMGRQCFRALVQGALVNKALDLAAGGRALKMPCRPLTLSELNNELRRNNAAMAEADALQTPAVPMNQALEADLTTQAVVAGRGRVMAVDQVLGLGRPRALGGTICRVQGKVLELAAAMTMRGMMTTGMTMGTTK
ncbi:hypothetical protein GCM10022278_27300 [Allohahella marinimesophila]|uniref:Uncharacterized protein n=1 Tax=Allohahella marinimesophila TaxID=1054972 RepID=A0ABP7PND0_9GAMM